MRGRLETPGLIRDGPGFFSGAPQPIAAPAFGWFAGLVSLFLVAGLAMFVISLALYLPFAELRGASY